MFRWIWLISSIVAGVKGLAILESELVKRIFQQDPSFCFQPSHLIGCNGTDSNVSLDQKKEGAFEENPSTLAFLFTRRNPSRPEFLHLCNYSLPNNTYFGTKFQTEIFIHGFLDGVCRSAWMREMKTELFKRGSYNVILVDWTWGNGPNYTESAENTKVVGRQIAFLIRNIMMQTGVSPDNFHLIGHSLGAHIAGFAGKIIKHLRRITALDPALAPFQNLTKEEKLDPSDANLVDVIHTNGGTKVGH